jgi:hypothetical protein
MSTKNLIITPVGDKSLHTEWLSGLSDNIDVCLCYYGDTYNKYLGTSKYYFESKGIKWELVVKALELVNIEDYANIWIPDDDIKITSSDIIKLFEMMDSHKFDIAQPSLTGDSYWSHVITVNKSHWGNYNNDSEYRLVTFVEIMAPCFNQKTFQGVKRFFPDAVPSYGHGLDLLYSLKTFLDGGRLAVIDSIQMRHTKPVGGNYDPVTTHRNMITYLQKYSISTNTCTVLRNVE